MTPVYLACSLMAFAYGALLLIVPGCAHLAPGADPVIVRVEQTESDARSTFSTLLKVDNQNRSYWATNAPAFHNYCEWLRAPIDLGGTNILPRDLAMIVSLNDVKRLYKSGLVQSNDLAQTQADLIAVVTDAMMWIKSTKTAPPPVPSVQVIHP